MTNYNLTINTIAGFESLEDARFAGQAVKRLLEASTDTISGAFRVVEVGTLNSHPFVKPLPDFTKYRKSSQEAVGNAQSLAKELDKSAVDTTIPAVEFWDEFFSIAKDTGEVDYEVAAKLAAIRLEVEDATENVIAAAGAVASNALARTLRKPAPKKR